MVADKIFKVISYENCFSVQGLSHSRQEFLRTVQMNEQTEKQRLKVILNFLYSPFDLT